jgi:hypothetical protein
LGRFHEPSLSRDVAEAAVAIPDVTMSVSHVHLRMGVDSAGVWLEDANSANGTTIVIPDGRLFDLEATAECTWLSARGYDWAANEPSASRRLEDNPTQVTLLNLLKLVYFGRRRRSARTHDGGVLRLR